ncbi:hypothetical protein LJC25_01480 [Bacteroidales bacterium OttesenSCG-928-K03]|nr:hypothetical protein [Odoribacter sp. OttesenSCG-928-L07]MDL2239256.1 hypothetical protein [Bacteroidales bacterium OttesenSCG-928-L14]MDL2242378.1 hypothetical protein [Bacteroidales bacterium OttesenSCG-928-K03]
MKAKSKKFLWITIAVLVVALSIFIYVKFYFVFAVGVKSGQLNYVTQKGYVFKTYEGKLIQSGFRSKTPGSLTSNEFEFSITNEEVAQKLMLSGGHEVDLHYKEYLGALPWRGYSKYVVDSIISIKEPNSVHESIPYEE